MRARLTFAAAAAVLALAGCGSTPGSPGDSLDGGNVVVTGEHRPLLSWEPVDGATEYRVVVTQDDGPEWAWTGATTEVVVGGGETPDRVGPGFELTGPAEVWVLALDGAGATISVQRASLG